MNFLPLGPEQVEEEARAEDGCYGDSNGDIVCQYADYVVIVDQSASVASDMYSILLIHVT